MLFHSSPELAETVAAERNRESTTGAFPVFDFVLSARGSRVIAADSILNTRQQHNTAYVLRDSAFECTLYRTFVQASLWCKCSLFYTADWVARMDLKMPF